jgi:hypothetical protein
LIYVTAPRATPPPIQARFVNTQGPATFDPALRVAPESRQERIMNRTGQLAEMGQSVWLDNISRVLLENGTLRRYIDELSVTGLTSNPSIFDKAIGQTSAYDRGIRDKTSAGLSGEALFIELALEDLRRAADLFRPTFDASDGIDGWVSMEVSPLLAGDAAGSIVAAARIHQQAGRPNLFVKIPGTAEGVSAIEESIYRHPRPVTAGLRQRARGAGRQPRRGPDRGRRRVHPDPGHLARHLELQSRSHERAGRRDRDDAVAQPRSARASVRLPE